MDITKKYYCYFCDGEYLGGVVPTKEGCQNIYICPKCMEKGPYLFPANTEVVKEEFDAPLDWEEGNI